MFFDNDIPPLLRFNKFIEKWNQYRLNDHAIVTMGQSPNSKNYTNNQTDKILVQGNADLYKNKVLKRVFTTEITKTAIKNDILISVRAPVGDIARNQYESVVIGRGIASIKGNDFLYYQLEKMKNSGFWNKYIAGSTFESITGKDLKNAKIYTTNSDEERKIGNIFSSLTNIIQLQEHKIDSLKKLKQFLLQNMFI
ncbi:restriction endonuclease subunit S [Ligilactobacillus salivarius]|uniref:restriction endonuclease subunit S n=1 Tax=Ligilactobacillus salivarius TaxID=1624 RepID=UPI003D036ABB